MYEETINRGRSAKRGDAVLLYHAQYLVGRKLLVVEHEHSCACNPLAIQLSPHGFAPTRVGNRKVNALRTQVVPKHARRDVTQRIKKIVGNHLGFAARTAGEVHQHDVVVVVNLTGAHKGGRLLHARLPTMETLGHVGTNADECLYRRAFGHRAPYLRKDIIFAHTNNGLNTGAVVAINNVVRGEHVGGRDGHSTNFAQGQHGNPPFVLAFKDEHHHVAAANAQRLKVRCSTVALPFQIGKGEKAFASLLAHPNERRFIWCFGRPSIHHIVGKIKVIRNDELQVLVVIFCRRESCLL